MNKKVIVFTVVITLLVASLIFFAIVSFGNSGVEYSNPYDKKTNKIKKDYLKNVSYEISKDFKEYKYERTRLYSYIGDSISCNFEIKRFVSNEPDGEQYLRHNIYFTLDDKVSGVEEVTLNDTKWYIMTKEGDNDITYYYATTDGKDGYEFSYEIIDYLHADRTSDVCHKEYDSIISSIKINK